MIAIRIEAALARKLKEEALDKNISMSAHIESLLQAKMRKSEKVVNKTEKAVNKEKPLEVAYIGIPKLLSPKTPIMYNGKATSLKFLIALTGISLLKIQARTHEGLNLQEIVNHYGITGT